MVLVGESVLKRARALFESLHHTRTNDNSAQRRVPAGCALAESDHVRHNAPVIDREWFSGAAHAGHHLIGDEKHIMLPTDFSDALDVAIGRHGSAQRRADDWLKNKSSD